MKGGREGRGGRGGERERELGKRVEKESGREDGEEGWGEMGRDR
jgi:hypothetical protein